MTGHRSAGSLTVAAACIALVGCGGPSPTIVKIGMAASATVNSHAGSPPRPLRVRVFRLAATQGFSRTDFFSLDGDPKKTLGPDLVGFDDVIAAPGGTATYRRAFEPEAHFVGVVAAFTAIDQSAWRAAQPVKPATTNSFTADLAGAAITLQPGGGK